MQFAETNVDSHHCLQNEQRYVVLTSRTRLDTIIAERRARREKLLELRHEIYEKPAISQVEHEDEKVITPTLDDLRRKDIQCFFAPNITILTMLNIRVTDVTSIIEDQPFDVVGKIYHIEDETYGKGEHQSILFWDKASFLRTRRLESIQHPNSFLLLLSFKIPVLTSTRATPISIFSHIASNSNIFSLMYDSTNHVLYIELLNVALRNENNRHCFSGPIYGDCMISVDATFDANTRAYACSFEVVRVGKSNSLEVSLKEFDVRIPTVNAIPDGSCIEFGKTTMFLRMLQYHVGDICEKDRVDCKTHFKKKWNNL